MSQPIATEAREFREHPSAPLLRMERIPHVWCPGCGIGTVVKCYATALENSESMVSFGNPMEGAGYTAVSPTVLEANTR